MNAAELELYFQPVPVTGNQSPGVWLVNATRNYAAICSLLATDRTLRPADQTAGPAIVTASGSSLDPMLAYLGKAQRKHKAALFVPSSQAWSMHAAGITPTYVVVHDPTPKWNRCSGTERTQRLSEITGTKWNSKSGTKWNRGIKNGRRKDSGTPGASGDATKLDKLLRKVRSDNRLR